MNVTSQATRLDQLQPDTVDAFAQALHATRAALSPSTRALMDRTLTATHAQCVREDEHPLGPADRIIADFCDQFVIAVGQTTDDQRQRLRDVLGDTGAYLLSHALYLTDMHRRLQQLLPGMLSMDFELPIDAQVNAVEDNSSMDRLIAEFAAAAVRADAVDPLTSELVRLRCAQTHRCRLCASLRVDQALDQGLNEDMVLQVANYPESLFSAAQKAALALADAIILQPLAADPGLANELAHHFTPEQIAEICFDVVKWSQQKALVALELDAASWDVPHVLSFDAHGHPVFGTAAYR